MRLIVVDPRRVGLASKADLWLRVRPGTDGALALGIANVMIERGWYDRDFIRDWSNGPLLVRADTGRLLTERDLAPDGDPTRPRRLGHARPRAARSTTPRTGRYDGDGAEPGARRRIPHRHARRRGRLPAGLRALRPRCAGATPPSGVEAICWIPRDQVEEAARLLWEARPVSYYAWSGLEQHANVDPDRARDLAALRADRQLRRARRQRAVRRCRRPRRSPAQDLPSAKQHGAGARPRRAPARPGALRARHLRRSLPRHPGGDSPIRCAGWSASAPTCCSRTPTARRGREALKALDFYVHADLFMNPTAELADVVLPVAIALRARGR